MNNWERSAHDQSRDQQGALAHDLEEVPGSLKTRDPDGKNGGEYKSARRFRDATNMAREFLNGTVYMNYAQRMLFKHTGIVLITLRERRPGAVSFEPPANGCLKNRTV